MYVVCRYILLNSNPTIIYHWNIAKREDELIIRNYLTCMRIHQKNQFFPSPFLHLNDADRSFKRSDIKRARKKEFFFSSFLFSYTSQRPRFVWILHFKFNPLSMQFVCIYGIFIQFLFPFVVHTTASLTSIIPSSDLE